MGSGAPSGVGGSGVLPIGRVPRRWRYRRTRLDRVVSVAFGSSCVPVSGRTPRRLKRPPADRRGRGVRRRAAPPGPHPKRTHARSCTPGCSASQTAGRQLRRYAAEASRSRPAETATSEHPDYGIAVSAGLEAPVGRRSSTRPALSLDWSERRLTSGAAPTCTSRPRVRRLAPPVESCRGGRALGAKHALLSHRRRTSCGVRKLGFVCKRQSRRRVTVAVADSVVELEGRSPMRSRRRAGNARSSG
jgi:hypothetical protein